MRLSCECFQGAVCFCGEMGSVFYFLDGSEGLVCLVRWYKHLEEPRGNCWNMRYGMQEGELSPNGEAKGGATRRSSMGRRWCLVTLHVEYKHNITLSSQVHY